MLHRYTKIGATLSGDLVEMLRQVCELPANFPIRLHRLGVRGRCAAGCRVRISEGVNLG